MPGGAKISLDNSDTVASKLPDAATFVAVRPTTRAVIHPRNPEPSLESDSKDAASVPGDGGCPQRRRPMRAAKSAALESMPIMAAMQDETLKGLKTITSKSKTVSNLVAKRKRAVSDSVGRVLGRAADEAPVIAVHGTTDPSPKAVSASKSTTSKPLPMSRIQFSSRQDVSLSVATATNAQSAKSKSGRFMRRAMKLAVTRQEEVSDGTARLAAAMAGNYSISVDPYSRRLSKWASAGTYLRSSRVLASQVAQQTPFK